MMHFWRDLRPKHIPNITRYFNYMQIICILWYHTEGYMYACIVAYCLSSRVNSADEHWAYVNYITCIVYCVQCFKCRCVIEIHEAYVTIFVYRPMQLFWNLAFWLFLYLSKQAIANGTLQLYSEHATKRSNARRDYSNQRNRESSKSISAW